MFMLLLALEIDVTSFSVYFVSHGLLIQLAKLLNLRMLLRWAMGVVDDHRMWHVGIGFDLIHIDHEIDSFLWRVNRWRDMVDETALPNICIFILILLPNKGAVLFFL